MNDTIVVNQPRLTTEDEVIIQDNRVHIDENTQVIVADLKDHVIIQDGDEQNVIRLEGDIEGEDMNQLVDGQVCNLPSERSHAS